jgi:hypothetical protein
MSRGVMLTTGSLAPLSLWLAFSSICTLFIRGKSEGELEDHLLVPDLVWGPFRCLIELQGNTIDFW